MHESLPNISRFLRRLRARQKGAWVVAGSLAGISLALVVLAAAVISETVGWFAPATRAPLAYGAAALAFALVLSVVIAAVVLALRTRYPSDERLARAVWRRDDEVRDRVLDAIQLAGRDDPLASRALRDAAVREADKLAAGLEPERYVERRAAKRAARGALAVLAVFALTFLIGRGSLIAGAHRLATPHSDYIRPGTVLLALDGPDSLRIVQGDTVRISARARHTRPERVDLVVAEGVGAEQVIAMRPDSMDSMKYHGEVAGLRRDATLWARAGKTVRSDTAFVEVIRRPRIARLHVRVHPPRYTGLDPVRLPEGVGDLSALPGSRVNVELTASRALADARLIVERNNRARADTVSLELDDRTARGSFPLRSAGSWWAEFTAADGVSSGDPLVWALGVSEDLHPRVEVHSPEDGGLIPEALVVPLAVAADDDYGISRIRLRYRVHSAMFAADSVAEDEYAARELPFEMISPGQAVVAARWSLADLPLLPTDEVHYFVEAWDNDTVNGPKRARSALRRLVFPSVEELYAMTEESEADVGEELRKAHEQAERTRQKLQETLTRLRSNPEQLSWDEARALQQALDDQEKALEQMQEVSQTLEQMQEQAREHNLMSEELLDKYHRLQELIEEVATPEMKEAMEKMREAMENLDGEQVRDAIEQMMMDQEKLLENLDRNLAILEQLKAERRLDELARRAENLAERQREISEQIDTASPDEMQRLSREQQSIEQRSEELAENIEEASEQVSELNPEVSDSLAAAAGEMKSEAFQQPMQQSAQSMQGGQRQQASRASKQAQENMQRIAQRLRNSQRRMVQQNQQQLAEEMSRVFQSVLVISRRQEDLRARSRSLGVASPRYRELAADQEALISGLGAVDREVEALMKKTFFVGANVAGNISRARAHMQEAIRRYTDRRPREVTGAQSDALAMLHRGLRALNQSQQQMMQSGSGTGYQEMMQKLQNMAQQQQGINNASGAPMPMPGGQMPGGLQQLAARQRALAERMQQLERESQSMEEILGSLDGLSKDMGEVADDLEDRNVSERTKRLQHRILQRLLDSQRSLQEREYSRKRKGEVASDIPRASPGELTDDEQDLIRRRLLRALESDYARAWRETIREYYRALEHDRAAQQESPPTSP